MKAVAGVFRNRMQAEQAISDLQSAGIMPDRVGVIAADQHQARAVANETGAEIRGGTAAGAGFGALFGGAAGWLIGIGMLVIPGLGPVVAAGPLAAALTGAGIGAVSGGIVGVLTGWGFSEAEAREYENRVKAGDILLNVEMPDDEDLNQAEDILRRNGGDRVSSGTAHRQAA